MKDGNIKTATKAKTRVSAAVKIGIAVFVAVCVAISLYWFFLQPLPEAIEGAGGLFQRAIGNIGE